MQTLNDLSTQEQQLQAQLAQIASDKEEAKRRERDEQLGLITVFENEANGYRNQAEKATTDDEKQRLYRFAQLADEQANELRKELGLISDEQLQATNDERSSRERLGVQRKVNSLLLKAIFMLIAFFVADFTSARLEMGFTSFVLKSAGQLCWSLSVALGGCWLVSSMLFGFVSTYVFTDLRTDFKSLMPGVRLAILAALVAALLHFLTGILPHAN